MFFCLALPQAVQVTPEELNALFQNLAIAAGVIFVLYIFFFFVLRFWFRRLQNDLPLVSLNVSRLPSIIVAIAISLKIALSQLAVLKTYPWIQNILSAGIAIAATFWVARLFTEVVAYALKKFAEQSEAMWDDVLIPILENTLPLLIYLIGGLVTIQRLGVDLSGLWVAIGGISFILGFALKDILSNFTSGLVLLIDTPFRFGDVIALPDGSRAVIKKIGLRVTEMYVIDTHCQTYLPNGNFEGQSIINLSRPTSHYYYSLNIPLKSDVDPARAIVLMEAVVLAHPDTLGEIDRKLEYIDKFYGFSESTDNVEGKREAGRKRLLTEKAVNIQLNKIEESFDLLAQKINLLEQGGLDLDEIRSIQGDFVDICTNVGLEVQADRVGRRNRQARLEEMAEDMGSDKLIGLIRAWYGSWLNDPDLIREDKETLPQEWEQKLSLLKLKLNKLFRKLNNPSGEETRLDDAIETLRMWLREDFKSSRNEWQDPKVWVNEVALGGRSLEVKFFVDDIKLEHCLRGNRVQSEINRDLNWQLRQAYLYT
ncbi:mechanosensitive ion channel family protein [Spirulina sp. 06S082]|uniref:mechanosensitive ion channel family protein n=1 Tax=Spirulina sp. 06S082 TaxID=3110248 RepID=UPI002B1FE0F9|nr:mechanosensitive ion channel family protein [Spirulina sp. 06S082]MEA5470812.1 mechanosensitive ion channel family protein [Spirulina sp. 06S082]